MKNIFSSIAYGVSLYGVEPPTTHIYYKPALYLVILNSILGLFIIIDKKLNKIAKRIIIGILVVSAGIISIKDILIPIINNEDAEIVWKSNASYDIGINKIIISLVPLLLSISTFIQAIKSKTKSNRIIFALLSFMFIVMFGLLLYNGIIWIGVMN